VLKRRLGSGKLFFSGSRPSTGNPTVNLQLMMGQGLYITWARTPAQKIKNKLAFAKLFLFHGISPLFGLVTNWQI
jgi:hypothetical protein